MKNNTEPYVEPSTSYSEEGQTQNVTPDAAPDVNANPDEIIDENLLNILELFGPDIFKNNGFTFPEYVDDFDLSFLNRDELRKPRGFFEIEKNVPDCSTDEELNWFVNQKLPKIKKLKKESTISHKPFYMDPNSSAYVELISEKNKPELTKGWLSVYDALNEWTEIYKPKRNVRCSYKTLGSKLLLDHLREFKLIKHERSNSFKDSTEYYFALEQISLYTSSKQDIFHMLSAMYEAHDLNLHKVQPKKGGLKELVAVDFVMYEIELWMFMYWDLRTQDLIHHNPHQENLILKNILRFLFRELLSTHANGQFSYNLNGESFNMLKKLVYLANFNNEKISVEFLFEFKNNFENLLQLFQGNKLFISYLNFFMSELNLHHITCPHTIKTILRKSSDYIKFLKKDFVSPPILEKHCCLLGPDPSSYILKKSYISSLFSSLFPKTNLISDFLVIAINNCLCHLAKSLATFLVDHGVFANKFSTELLTNFVSMNSELYSISIANSNSDVQILANIKDSVMSRFLDQCEKQHFVVCKENKIQSEFAKFSMIKTKDHLKIYHVIVRGLLEGVVGPISAGNKMYLEHERSAKPTLKLDYFNMNVELWQAFIDVREEFDNCYMDDSDMFDEDFDIDDCVVNEIESLIEKGIDYNNEIMVDDEVYGDYKGIPEAEIDFDFDPNEFLSKAKKSKPEGNKSEPLDDETKALLKKQEKKERIESRKHLLEEKKLLDEEYMDFVTEESEDPELVELLSKEFSSETEIPKTKSSGRPRKHGYNYKEFENYEFYDLKLKHSRFNCVACDESQILTLVNLEPQSEKRECYPICSICLLEMTKVPEHMKIFKFRVSAKISNKNTMGFFKAPLMYTRLSEETYNMRTLFKHSNEMQTKTHVKNGVDIPLVFDHTDSLQEEIDKRWELLAKEGKTVDELEKTIDNFEFEE